MCVVCVKAVQVIHQRGNVNLSRLFCDYITNIQYYCITNFILFNIQYSYYFVNFLLIFNGIIDQIISCCTHR